MATIRLTLVSYTVYFARAIRSKHGITPTASTIIGLVIELRLDKCRGALGRAPDSQHLYRFAKKKLSQP